MNILLPSWATPLSAGFLIVVNLIVVNGTGLPIAVAEPGLAQSDTTVETQPAPSADAQQGDGPQAEGDRLFQSGLDLREEGDLEAALAVFEAALALYEEGGDRQSQIDTLNQIGNVYLDLGQHEEASVAFQEAIALQQQDAPQPTETARVSPDSESQPISGTRSPGVSTSDESSRDWGEPGGSRGPLIPDIPPPPVASPLPPTVTDQPNFGEPGGSRGLTPSRQTSNIVAIAPPDIAQPGWGEPGGSRGSVLGGVERIDRTLVALVDDGPALAVYPTLFIYLPDLVEAVTSVYGPLKITITLLDSQGTVVHEASRLTPDTAGILGIPLADLEGLAPLLSNQVYEWQLQIASLDPDLVLEGAILMGRIEQLDGSAVEFPVNTMTVPEDYSTYGDAGIWYDAVAILFSQWQVTPDDPVLASALQELLLSVGLEDRISPHSFIGYWSDLEEIDNATIDEDEESQTGHSNSSNGMGSTFIPPSVELIPMGSPGGTR